MDMSRALRLSGIAGAVLLAGALAALARPPDRPMRRGPGGPEGARFLGLTSDQQAQLEQQREARRPEMEALGQKLRENHQRLQAALEAASPDPATVGAIVIEGHGLQLQMRKLREEGDKAFRALLTPEQQAKFDALQLLHRERGPMGPPAGPPPEDEP
jgi:Spy/CpxP family protein refolding chaperone